MTVLNAIKNRVRAGAVRVGSVARIANRRWIARQTKLHLGCGNAHVDGYLNVDASPYSRGVDVVCRLESLERIYPAGNAELIYACHVLEHLSHAEADEMLAVFYRLLRPGGELRISVPDMDRIVRIYSENWEHFQTPGNSPWIGLVFGGQTDSYDYHRTGFNLCWLKYLLERRGFDDVREYPHEPQFLGIRDASLAKEPFGEYISLNVSARKTLPGAAQL